MPRNYKRKTNRQSWSEESMKNAIIDVTSGKCGFKKASQVYGVPKSTLEYRIKIYRNEKDLEVAARKGLGRFKSVFSLENEKLIIEYIKLLEQRLFSLSHRDIRSLAYEMADKYNLQNNFNEETKLAGKDWLHNFLNRHNDLCLDKKPLLDFYDILERLIDQNSITASRIYNVGEVSITTAATRQSQILTTKNTKQIRNFNLVDEEQVTTILCFSSTGYYVPPLFIFPRVQMKAELLVGFPPDSVVVCHPTGLIQSEIFVEWLQHFISQVHPSKEQPVLLLLNGHTNYSKSFQFLELAKNNGIILLSFPLDFIHTMQPLYVSFVAPLNSYYTEEVTTWLNNHPECVVTQYQIAELFGNAYLKAASLFNAMIGFKNTGIQPLNRYTLYKNDYAPSEMTKWLLDQAERNLSLVKTENDKVSFCDLTQC
ncbi:uncharacterized protein [Chelonus insularis]|uniref:uncharacterized protein n=1 Tax=Chelonus insularis TaxID=460826 RepID=UPI00158BE7DB|nr:uncharacterized protein LOC118070518 [Chelonus insularis]